MVSGFDKTIQMVEYEGRMIVGDFIAIGLPYLKMYEWYKFGNYASASALEGLKNTQANVLIMHSKDDTRVPYTHYETFYNEFSNNDKFTFVSYDQLGHNYILMSQESQKYMEEVYDRYDDYLKEEGTSKCTNN